MKRILFVGVLAIALIATVEAKRRPHRRHRAPATSAGGAASPPAARVDVRIAEAGQLTEVHVEGNRFRLRSTAGAIAVERTLGEVERQRISADAREAARQTELRRSCGRNETFVTVTVDGKTTSNAVCPHSSRQFAGPWRNLVATVRWLATPPPAR